uniref:Uncharacterized protein n=1 Tax=Oryza glumipatula TaxID=40148 RepID=A0A0D9ZQ46_9ORYZ
MCGRITRVLNHPSAARTTQTRRCPLLRACAPRNKSNKIDPFATKLRLMAPGAKIPSIPSPPAVVVTVAPISLLMADVLRRRGLQLPRTASSRCGRPTCARGRRDAAAVAGVACFGVRGEMQQQQE